MKVFIHSQHSKHIKNNSKLKLCIVLTTAGKEFRNSARNAIKSYIFYVIYFSCFERLYFVCAVFSSIHRRFTYIHGKLTKLLISVY